MSSQQLRGCMYPAAAGALTWERVRGHCDPLLWSSQLTPSPSSPEALDWVTLGLADPLSSQLQAQTSCRKEFSVGGFKVCSSLPRGGII